MYDGEHQVIEPEPLNRQSTVLSLDKGVIQKSKTKLRLINRQGKRNAGEINQNRHHLGDGDSFGEEEITKSKISNYSHTEDSEGSDAENQTQTTTQRNRNQTQTDTETYIDKQHLHKNHKSKPTLKMQVHPTIQIQGKINPFDLEEQLRVKVVKVKRKKKRKTKRKTKNAQKGVQETEYSEEEIDNGGNAKNFSIVMGLRKVAGDNNSATLSGISDESRVRENIDRQKQKMLFKIMMEEEKKRERMMKEMRRR